MDAASRTAGSGRRVLVVGGGISGLSTAYFLRRDGQFPVRLVEADRRVGGTLGSDLVDGFLFERGPNGFLDNVLYTLDLARELGLESSLLCSSDAARRRYLLKDGKLQVLPSGPIAFLRSKLLSWKGRLRVLTEPFRRAGEPHGDESLASFARRRLGEEACVHLVDAFQTGIYAGDVERLSVASAFPMLARLEKEHGSLFRGLVKSRKARRKAGGAKGPAGARLWSFEGGLEQLVSTLHERLGDCVTTAAPVDAVARREDGFHVTYRDGRTENTDSVVVAVPAPRAASLFGSSRPDLARALEAMPYAPIAVVCLGFQRSQVNHPLDGFGFLVPRNQGFRTLGMIWTSSVFPRHAPEGAVSFRAMVGGARDPDAVERSADELIDLVLREMGPVLGIQGDPTVRRVYRYVQGIPQYNVGHARRVQRIEDQRWGVPGLWLTGNAYRGVGINDCVRESKKTSEDVLRAAASVS